MHIAPLESCPLARLVQGRKPNTRASCVYYCEFILLLCCVSLYYNGLFSHFCLHECRIALGGMGGWISYVVCSTDSRRVCWMAIALFRALVICMSLRVTCLSIVSVDAIFYFST